MNALRALASAVDAVNEGIGRVVSWLALVLVVVQFGIVLMRYVYGVGAIAVQESILIMHGVLFLVAAGYALLYDAHVRVDVFYGEAKPRKKAMVDLIGCIVFLAPFIYVIWDVAFPYVASSWAVKEASNETSGLPGIYLFKTTILAFTVLVGLQGVALALRSILVIAGLAETNKSRTGGAA
ncbi:MAG: C4-dicarboxylate ABC transporter permease [Tistrella sp.]|uniref:TRAP transporter small permease protein n=1 Tax=Tistrella mobilis TaxID=171437 RepID=A0A3B9IFA1_9PROT|nr:TRAP transporter small permease subunit [Tistrella sp.]MAD36710.1 C4-dicarboxylate ABC transporter permease [Tistrella sp.]MBA75817.1 C4-dicarboxylate ABC transporter permease [Tistrella sp.]HAE46475.1 C4-dicarboxylate ABC transporter permease [Tistrella mobilis]